MIGEVFFRDTGLGDRASSSDESETTWIARAPAFAGGADGVDPAVVLFFFVVAGGEADEIGGWAAALDAALDAGLDASFFFFSAAAVEGFG